MGLLPTGLKEDTQQLQHRAPGRMERVCQALFHCPAKEQHSQDHSHITPGDPGAGTMTHRPQRACIGEGQQDKVAS